MATRLLYEMFLPREGRADVGLGKSGSHRMGNDQDLPTKIPVRKGRDAQYNRGPGHTRPFKSSRRDHQDEARFPDEKFWDREGNPIHPEPKGPPPGTVGKTHKDIGSTDRDDPRASSEEGTIGGRFSSNADPRGDEDHGPFKSIEDLAHFISDVEGGDPSLIERELQENGSYDGQQGHWTVFPWDQAEWPPGSG